MFRRIAAVFVGFLLTACAPKDPPAARADSASVTPVPVAAASAPASPVGAWRWVSIVTPVETVTAPTTGQYTLVLTDSSVHGVADCNRLTGQATIADKSLTFGPIATTRMACPQGGMGDRYLRFLGGAANWFFRDDTMFVDLKMDSGTMRFVRAD